MFTIPHTHVKSTGANGPLIGFQLGSSSAALPIVIEDGETSDAFTDRFGNIIPNDNEITLDFIIRVESDWRLAEYSEGYLWIWLPDSYPNYPDYNEWKDEANPEESWVTLFRPAYLTCGSNTDDDSRNWEAITDGSFKITIDGTDYNVDAIDFTGVASMADVAVILQIAIRAETSSLETVVWDTDHFIISSVLDSQDDAITVLSTITSGTVGTDISGAGATNWMDGDEGNGVVTDMYGFFVVSVESYGGVSGKLYRTYSPVVYSNYLLRYNTSE